MSFDPYGCPLSTENQEVVNLANQFSSELLRLGKDIDVILERAEKYPDEVILQLYAALFCLYGQTEASFQQAGIYLDNTSRLIARANLREKNLFSVAWHWRNHLLTDALKDIERLCFKWPNDLTALKIAEFLFYCKGQKYESRRFLRLTTQCLSRLRDNPYFQSIHSLALELCNHYEESRQFANEALTNNEDNPWAQHTLAHLYLNTGQIEEGIAVLERYAPSWKNTHSIIESHLLWHLALLYLENLNFDKAAEIYQRADWLHQTTLVSEQIDAIALLWRMDMEGHSYLHLWEELAKAIGSHANFGVIPFISAQLVYALKKGGRTEALHEALDAIAKRAHEQIQEDRYVWREVGLPLIYGTLAFAEDDYHQAVRYLDPIIKHVGCVGGSDAQIDLFYQTYLKSLIGAHRYGDAEALLHQMTSGRNLTRLERKWLSECHWEEVPLRRTG